MNEEERDFYWYWFVNIRGIGNVTRNKLLSLFGHPKHIYHGEEKEVSKVLGPKQMMYFRKSRNKKNIIESMQRLEQNRIRFIHWESDEYPDALRHIYDPPYGLYLIGRMPEKNKPVLGMVGARNATIYGRKTAENFAKILAENGIQIISGLAAGIDAASHRGALRAGRYTMGILGGGIDTIYPRENFNLYMEMYERGGVLSEYNMGVENYSGLFPARNRLISGMSDGIMVVEAGESSGSLITVDQALEQGKDVFSLPGRITDPMSVGCNRLIAQGAYLVQTPEEILHFLKEKGNKGSLISEQRVNGKEFHGRVEPEFHSPEQKNIYELLDEVIPKNFDMLLQESGYNIRTLQHILFEMELLGWIYQPNQNTYLKIFL